MKTLLLDLDGTLLDFATGERNAFDSLTDLKGRCDLDRLRSIYRQSNNAAWRLYEAGKLSIGDLAAERFRAVADIIGDVSPENLGNEFLFAMSQQAQLYPDSFEMVQRLQSRYLLSIATNGFVAVQTARIARSPLAKYITNIFASEAINHPKPSHSFFESIARELNCNINELVLVGDSLHSDVLGPAVHGVKTIHFCRQLDTCNESDHTCFNTASEIVAFLEK